MHTGRRRKRSESGGIVGSESKPRSRIPLARGSSFSASRAAFTNADTIFAVGLDAASRAFTGNGAHAGVLGIGVAQAMAQLVPPHDQRAAVLRLGFNEELDPRRCRDLTQPCDEPPVLPGLDAPRPAVGDVAVGIEGAEVEARRHVAGLEREVDAHGGKHAAADLVLGRVVAEEAQVAGARAGRYANPHRVKPPAATVPGEEVQIWLLGSREGCESVAVARQVAQAIQHQEQDARRGLLGLPLNDLHRVHRHLPHQQA